MDCLNPSPDVLQPITVVEWLSSTTNVTHTFNNPGDEVMLYPDDTLLRAFTKISVMLNKKGLPYVWSKNKSLLFNVKSTNWRGYKVKPFDASFDQDATSKPSLVYHEKTLLGDARQFNIVYKEATTFPNNEHYFPEWSTKIPTIAAITKEEDILKRLLSYTVNEHLKLQRKDQTCTYSHIVFQGSAYKKQSSFTFLQDMFERLHANSDIPFIQWMDDPTRILYKVHQHHVIPSAMFNIWTSMDRLPKVKTSLILYSPIGKRNIYARVYLSLEGDMTITYHMDARDKINWTTIEKHKDFIVSFVATYTGIKYDVKVSDISVRSELVVAHGVSMNTLASFMSGLLPIFHVIKFQQGRIQAIYKRASNYNDNIQLTEYIQSKLDMGVTVPEIIENLVDMGIPRDEVMNYIDQVANVQENVNIKKVETGTVVNLSKLSYGVKIHVANAASIEEVRRIFHWIRSCILHLPNLVAPERQRKVPTLLSSSSSSSKKNAVHKTSSPKTASSNALQESIESDDLDFLGGAVGKEHQRYFLNMLQEADPTLFSSTEHNYAKMCQASAFHQPVALTLEERDKMLSEGYGDAIDNMITYGSDPNKQHAYFCPRIWCPALKRPLTYESYVRHGNKCPNGEQAKLMYEHSYWGNSHETKHFIGFHKNKTSSGLCLPCCYVKKPKSSKEAECMNPIAKAPSVGKKSSESLKPASSSSPKDDAYLMTQPAPLPEGRNGTIPQVLHEIITPGITYQLCNKTLTSQQCPVRRGLNHQNDSLMNALAYSLSKKNKKELVAWIKASIDPLTFLSLENGHVVAAFVSDEGMIPSEHRGLVKEMLRHLAKYPKYAKTFGLENIQDDPSKMSRELQLYQAWLRYFEYLESDEVKSPHHLYDLFHKLGYLLVIWDKDSNTDIQLRCPMFSSVGNMLHEVREHRKTIMLLHENDLYEPIEMRKRNADSIRVLDTKYTTTIDGALEMCEAPKDDGIILKLQTLKEWIRVALFHPQPFAFESCVVAPNLCIAYIKTKGGILIKLPPNFSIGVLPKLLDELHISKVVYQEDWKNTTRALEFLTKDFDAFARKLRDIGLGYDVGVIDNTIKNAGYYNTIMMMPHPTVAPKITITTRNEVSDFARKEDATQKKWHHLQLMISNTFVDHYDTLVQPTLSMSRKDRVATLANTFPSIPDRKMVQIAIEEMPLEYGKLALKAWQKTINYDKRFPFFSDNVVSNQKEWIFSQYAVDNSDMSDIVKPIASHGSRPSRLETPFNSTTDIASLKVASNSDDNKAVPQMLSEAATTSTRLPSKWTQMRAYEWAKYNVLKSTNYTRESMPQLIEWIATKRGAPVVWGDIVLIRYKYVLGALQDEELMLLLLEDPSLQHAFAQIFGKSYKQPKQLWERGFTRTPFPDLKRMWETIAASNTLWCSDLDLYTAAKLLNVTILVLHRSKYGVSKENRKRGDFDDLSVSSSLYTQTYTMTHANRVPLCILYKDTEGDHAVYHPITDQNKTFIFSSLFDCPKDIQLLVEHLVANNIRPSYK